MEYFVLIPLFGGRAKLSMLDKEETEQQFKDKKLEIILSDYDAL